MTFKDFVMKQFDKLLLTAILVMCLGICMYLFIYHPENDLFTTFATGLVLGRLSALDILITGNASKATSNPENEPK